MQVDDKKKGENVHLLLVGKDPENVKGFIHAFKEVSFILNDIRFAGKCELKH